MEKQRSFSFKPTRLLVFSFTISTSVIFFTFFTLWVIKATPSFRQEIHFQYNKSSLSLGLRPITVQSLSSLSGNLSVTGEKDSTLIDTHYSSLENASGFASTSVFSGLQREEDGPGVLVDGESKSDGVDGNLTTLQESIPETISEKIEVPSSQMSEEKSTVAISSDNNGVSIREKIGLKRVKDCDLTKGRWVYDESYPLYTNGSCPFIDEGFNCEGNGRLDKNYMKWRWQPHDCEIPRFNATKMLELIRGKRLVFVGDSINRNQWESMLCMLMGAIKDPKRVYETHRRRITKEKGDYSIKFMDYRCTVEYYATHFLVHEAKARLGHKRIQTLRIDSIDRGTSRWRGADILVFNTAHWWTHYKTKTGINYYQEGNQVHPRLDVSTAFRRALMTWASWVDRHINPRKTQVFFRSSAPSHFRGGEWNSGGHCMEATQPLNGKNIVNNMRRKPDNEADNDLEDNHKRLKEEAKKLYARRDDILAQTKTKLVNQVCEAWISRVMKSEEEVRELEIKYNDEKSNKKRRSQHGSSKSRTDLSKIMAEKCDELHNLWLEEKSKIGILVEKLPERVIIMHGPKPEDKPFLHSIVEKILGHLRDKNVKRFGLWGMPGIGKTTIMKSLNNYEDIAKMFDIVIWVTVSKDLSLEKLQHKIADRLKLNTEGITEPEIAQQIWRELKSKRYLLLLDEVWDTLDLSLIGMYESEMDSKVVLATRYLHVCSDMDTHWELEVKRLSEADAWNMFKVKVGRHFNIPNVESIAKEVVIECAGLPLLIDKVASNFRRRDNIHLWRDGLRSLRRWPSINIQGIGELIECLEFCYENLKDEGQKDCFLYCALYTEDYEIHTDPLLECWTVEGFIHDASEFRVARGIGHSILKELISVSLLEKSGKVNHVRMNKVIRTMALNISSRRCNFNILVKPHGGLQKVPDEVEWQQANRISLMDSKLGTLPEMPDCNKLSTLLLQRNRELKEIPDLFFQYMQNLRVLDLHGTGITLLPPTISVLKCLRALYLHSCISLMNLHLNGLEHLEVLDIRDTGLNHFPIQIRHLIRLKCLRMSLSNFGIRHSSDVESCRNVFSSLYLLEELQIIVDSNNQSWELTVKAISEGVATLMHLTSLSICFPTVDCLKSFISTSQLWKVCCFTFQFSVGYHDTALYKILGCFEYQNMNCLKFANGEGVDPIISEVLLKTHAFELIGHKGASRLSDFGVDSINKMRGCLIEGCNEIETIVDGNSITGSALICLEKMLINNVPNLKTVWEGPVHYGSLSQLTTLTLCNCLNLKMIFSSGMIKELSKLQHLEVEECPEIEEIITESQNIGLEPDVLPRLKILVLSNLPRVKRILTSDSLKWPSLERIKISMCQILTKLPFNNENAINLRCIEADQSWWSALECQDDAIKQRLSSIWFQSP